MSVLSINAGKLVRRPVEAVNFLRSNSVAWGGIKSDPNVKQFAETALWHLGGVYNISTWETSKQLTDYSRSPEHQQAITLARQVFSGAVTYQIEDWGNVASELIKDWKGEEFDLPTWKEAFRLLLKGNPKVKVLNTKHLPSRLRKEPEFQYSELFAHKPRVLLPDQAIALTRYMFPGNGLTSTK